MENDLRRQGETDWEAFERGVDAALASGPKPRTKTDQPFLSLLVEMRRLVDEPVRHAFGTEGLRRLLKVPGKCLTLKLDLKSANATGKAIVAFEPSDAFLRLAAALRACDWQTVRLIEHEITSS